MLDEVKDQADSQEPKRKGRRTAIIDLDLVERHASRGLTKKQVCDCLGISYSTFTKAAGRDLRIHEAYDRGYAKTVMLMKNALFEAAIRGEWKAAEAWLKGHAEMEQKIKVENSGPDGGPIEIVDLREKLHERIEKLVGRSDASAASETADGADAE